MNHQTPFYGQAPNPQRLKKRLRERGLIQKDLARHLDLSTQSITRMVQGRNKTSAFTYDVARFLEVSPEWLMGYDAPKEWSDPEEAAAWRRELTSKPSTDDVADILKAMLMLAESKNIDDHKKVNMIAGLLRTHQGNHATA